MAIHKNDEETMIVRLAEKIAALRIFEDEAGKLNRSIKDTGGELLVVSQFTLYGDCAKGNRPSFIDAAGPEQAESYYNRFIDCLKERGLTIATGKFRSYMKVALVNDGPTTVIIDI